MKVRSLWHNSAKSWIGEETEADSASAIVEAKYSLIIHGTEKRVVSHGVPKDLHSQMSIPYMRGSFDADFTYGYSLVGEVIKGEADHKGKLTHLLHPHQSISHVDASDLFILPDELDPKIATLASNAETALNALWDSGIAQNEKILVVGYGLIGALIAEFARVKYSAQVYVSETNQTRLNQAHDSGFAVAPQQKVFQYAFHTSGTSSGLQVAIDSLAFEGKVIELSWHSQPVTIDLGGSFHSLRKQIVSSQVSHIAAPVRANVDFKQRKKIVLELLKQSNVHHLIDREIHFDEAPGFFDKLRKGEIENIATLIKY